MAEKLTFTYEEVEEIIHYALLRQLAALDEAEFGQLGVRLPLHRARPGMKRIVPATFERALGNYFPSIPTISRQLIERKYHSDDILVPNALTRISEAGVSEKWIKERIEKLVSVATDPDSEIIIRIVSPSEKKNEKVGE